MASSTSIQSFCGRRVFSSAASVPLKRNVQFRVKSMSNEGSDNKQVAPSPSPAPTKPKVSTDLFDLLAFGGPGHERINGRLAMVTAIGVELANGQDIFAQVQNPWFLYTSALLSVASLIPLFQGRIRF